MISTTRRELLTAAGAAAASLCAGKFVLAAPASPIADATETAAMIRRREISALEAIDAAIARAEALQPKLNFMVTPLFELARERAREFDKAGKLTGPFAGVPYLVKDMYDVKGAVTRHGSRCTQGMPPATAQPPYVSALEAAGLVFIGKSALGEFGYLPTTEPLAFGPTRNPWNSALTPGGSSGGSAAAVAAGVLPFADAADGGGSIRIPASACGLFGLKPSRDRLIGTQPASGSFSLVAEHCLSRSVRDSAALFALTERTGANATLPPIGAVTGPSRRRLRIGYLVNSMNNRPPEAAVLTGLEATGKLLQDLGHHVEPTQWPFDGAAFSNDFSTLWISGVAGVIDLVRKVAGREPDESMLEPFTLAMGREAGKLPAGALAQAEGRLRAVAAAYDDWLARYDVILSPVLLQLPAPIGHIAGDVPFDTLVDRLFRFGDYTTLHNLAGAPAMSVPLHWTADNLPVGMQFAARMGQERVLFELAYELEAARPWAARRPPIFV